MARKQAGQMAISADDFSEALQSILDEYGEEVDFAMEEAIRQTSLDDVKDLEKGGAYNGGAEYNAGWDSKEQGKAKGKLAYVVYNASKPGLAHLLEFGHAKQNGGRTRAFAHIAPVNEETGDRVIKHLEELL